MLWNVCVCVCFCVALKSTDTNDTGTTGTHKNYKLQTPDHGPQTRPRPHETQRQNACPLVVDRPKRVVVVVVHGRETHTRHTNKREAAGQLQLAFSLSLSLGCTRLVGRSRLLSCGRGGTSAHHNTTIRSGLSNTVRSGEY